MHSAYRVTRSLNLAAALAVAWTISVAADAQAQANPWGAEAGKGSGRYADVNEIKLYCEISGSGRPLVLLHGGLGAIEMFGPISRHSPIVGRSSLSICRVTGGRPEDWPRLLGKIGEAMKKDFDFSRDIPNSRRRR